MESNWECNSNPPNCQAGGDCEKCSKNEECNFCKNQSSRQCNTCENRRKLGELKKERLRSYLEKKSMQERIRAELKECQGEERGGIRDRLEKQKEKCQETCRNIIMEIEMLENEEEKNVLFNRYIQGKKWEDICVQLSVSWRKVHYIHKRALANYKIWNKKQKFQRKAKDFRT